MLKQTPVMLLILFLSFSYGCSSEPALEDSDSFVETETISLPNASHQAFINSLEKDCLKLKGDGTFRQGFPKESPKEIDARVDHYCTCFVNEFKRQFSAKDLDNFLEKNKELPSEALDDIAETCSIHIEDLSH